MKFIVVTLFPDMIRQACRCSVIGRALEKGLIELETVDIRDFSRNNYHSVDDYPFGGGAGMVMQAEPVYDACQMARQKASKDAPLIFLSPAGKTLTQAKVRQLSKQQDIILLCGHYEGIDQRVLDEVVTEEISMGDYVLTGGEIPALCVIDAVSRMVDGVLGNQESPVEESFSGQFLEYPQYSRPRVFHGKEVPEVLLSGNHAEIRKWRLEKAIETTVEKRPDLICEDQMTKEEHAAYEKVLKESRLQNGESVV